MIKKCWFRQRSYAHFDRALSKKEAFDLVSNKKRVTQHAFWPLIVRPMKLVYRVSTDSGRRIIKTKKRPIAYASHTDSYIYSYYAAILSKYLEEEYQKSSICNQSVLAYRTFMPPKSNIHFANEPFSYIKEKGSCEVIALDVEGFFDNLDHQILKKTWQNLLKCKRLSSDHYAVFKASTGSYGVRVSTLRDLFCGEIRTQRGKTNAVICTPSEFRSKVVPQLKPLQDLVGDIKGKPSNKTKGIPQGLPISAILANLYMLSADQELSDYIDKMGGIYRRYSDDILIVVPEGKGNDAKKSVYRALEKLQLTIQTAKTQHIKVSLVTDKSGKPRLKILDLLNSNKLTKISYLGFEFDGENILVRQSSISKFMIMATREIHRAVIAAQIQKQPLKKRKLYARLTSLGYGRAYGNIVSADHDEIPKGIPRLGFFKYLSRAAKITRSPGLHKQKEQLKNRIIRMIKEAEKR